MTLVRAHGILLTYAHTGQHRRCFWIWGLNAARIPSIALEDAVFENGLDRSSV
jgi:hypothetical protein